MVSYGRKRMLVSSDNMRSRWDATVFRPSHATWFSSRTTAGILIQQFGVGTDRPIPSAFVPRPRNAYLGEAKMTNRNFLVLTIFAAFTAAVFSLRVDAQCAVPSFNLVPTTSNPNISAARPVVGDFDRDGNPDVAFTNFNLDSVTIALGNGVGGFTSTNIPTADGATQAAIGDFNRDGIPDLAVSNTATADNITILLGTGSGGFTSGITIPTDGGRLALGDFNRDGIEDIVVLPGGAFFKIYLGNGSGGFTAQPPIATDGVQTSVVVGDLNRDGREDVAFTQFASGRVAVFLGNGSGGFGTQTNFGVGKAPDAISLADLNNDNRVDIITANVASSNISVLLGNGAGGFAAVTNYPTTPEPRSLATADFNSDGKPDIIVGHIESAAPTLVSVFKNIGNGMFAPEVGLPLSGIGNAVAAGDFNRDGKDDIFVGVDVLAPSGPDFFGTLLNACKPSPSNDFTGDGRSDIAIFRPSSGFWFVLRSEDFSFFAFPFGANGDVPAPADFDGDGIVDPAVFRPSNSTWFISRSTGGTTTEQFGISTDLPSPADYDGDGKADIAIYRPGPGEWWIKRSTGGIFATQFGIGGDIPIR